MAHESRSNEKEYVDLEVAKSFHIIHRDIVAQELLRTAVLIEMLFRRSYLIMSSRQNWLLLTMSIELIGKNNWSFVETTKKFWGFILSN